MTATNQQELASLLRTATGEAAERAALYKELSQEELLSLLFSRDTEIENIKKTRRYGLVWDEKAEEFDINTVGKIPALSHVPSLGVVSSPNAQDHVLIKGDNYHALKALTFTHEGAVDVIYIDPPYNTGNKDFKYNDKFIDREDGYRHSKWLSFMAKRLRLAKQLLKETGIIFISIDDNEFAQLRLLCDQIFGEDNGLLSLVWELPRGINAGHVAKTHEYVFAYAANKPKLPPFLRADSAASSVERCNKKIDARHPASEITFPAGVPYEGPDQVLSGVIEGTERVEIVGQMVFRDGKLAEPVTLRAGWTMKNMIQAWLAGESVKDLKGQSIEGFFFKKNGKLYSQKRLTQESVKSVLKDVGDNQVARQELYELFHSDEIFSYPKPTGLLKHLLRLLPKDVTVLDFFAGSGTTGHAVMQLNAEDGEAGKRRCILVTNDEGEFKDADGNLLPGGICTNVTYPRLRKVIEGYTTPKGKEVSGLAANLHFYETKFVEEKATRSGRQALMAETVDMLNLKEGCFTAVKSSDKRWKTFTNGSRHLVVLFDGMAGEECAADIQNLKGDVAVYAFSFYEDDDIAEDFEHLPNVRVRTMPDALLKAYRRLTLNKSI